jgi:hypothetical protein
MILIAAVVNRGERRGRAGGCAWRFGKVNDAWMEVQEAESELQEWLQTFS